MGVTTHFIMGKIPEKNLKGIVMKVSKHAVERMVERKLKAIDLAEAFKNPGRIQHMPNGSIRHWHKTKNVCVVWKDDTVITVMFKEKEYM